MQKKWEGGDGTGRKQGKDYAGISNCFMAQLAAV